jgi:methyl-accepting chemotaxis protein/methyl-accepting chemotaxis protein-1 (serine sensor receptor)
MLLLASIAAAVGIALALYIVRGINAALTQTALELQDGVDQMVSASSEVSASSQSLSQGASEQAASLEETSASSEEINIMAHKNTENASAMAQLVADSKTEFINTNRQLGEMMTAMDDINDSSGKIAKIIKIIDEIAFQTNILALNAAVEAARAGEAGMGFAVVADEVRNLAQRSAQAAKDTADLIEDSATRSAAGKTKLAGVVTSIKLVSGGFTSIGTLVDEVSHGSKEQSIGIEQIRRSLSQMERVTQATAANAEETAAASAELNAQAASMKECLHEMARHRA